MLIFIAFLHIAIAIFLVIFVLIQDSKGGAMGMLGGGGSSSVFGSSGADNFLVKITRWTAILFAATCIGLAYLTNQKSNSVLDNYVPPAKEAGAVDAVNTTPPKATKEEAPAKDSPKESK